MKKIKEIYLHVYFAIRYGEWSWGWEMYDNKPMFGFFHEYYDGNYSGFHCYKLWISVIY